MRRLFLGYAGGKVFTVTAAKRFGRFALALLLTAIADPTALLVLSLWLSWLGAIVPPGAVISFSSTDVSLVLNLIRKDASKGSMRIKFKRAAWKDGFLEKILAQVNG